eukprot:NODE_566_length_6624_cov_0.216245.p3 type:complete len:188 gc:universal NODE_566_length_6624_cov_0.216245:1667-1104(-)
MNSPSFESSSILETQTSESTSSKAASALHSSLATSALELTQSTSHSLGPTFLQTESKSESEWVLTSSMIQVNSSVMNMNSSSLESSSWPKSHSSDFSSFSKKSTFYKWTAWENDNFEESSTGLASIPFSKTLVLIGTSSSLTSGASVNSADGTTTQASVPITNSTSSVGAYGALFMILVLSLFSKLF